MLNFFEFTSFLGNLLRLVGLALFGFAAGCVSLKAYKDADNNWPLKVAIYLGFFLFITIALVMVSPGSGGSLALGAAIALLYFANKKEMDKEEDDKDGEGK